MKNSSKIFVFIIIILLICIGIMGYSLYKTKNVQNNTSNISSNSVNNSKSNDTQSGNTQINNTSSNNTAVNQTNNSTENNTTNTSSKQENKNSKQEKTIVKELTPSGFAGSSMKRVVLYSNKDVYLIEYDGIGFEEKNIISTELIAKNVDDIKKSNEEESDGVITIKGGEKVKTDIGWINFE